MILPLVSILSGIVYFAVTPWHSYPGMIVLKTLPVASLGLYALRKRHVNLGVAVLLSAAGGGEAPRSVHCHACEPVVLHAGE